MWGVQEEVIITERVDRRNRRPEEENRGDNNHHPLNAISNRVGNWGYPLQYHIWNLHDKLRSASLWKKQLLQIDDFSRGVSWS